MRAAQTFVGATESADGVVEADIESPLQSGLRKNLRLTPTVARASGLRIERLGRETTLLSELSEKSCNLTQAVKIQQRLWAFRLDFEIGLRRIVSRTGGNHGMETIREPDDEVRIETTANTNDLNSLAA